MSTTVYIALFGWPLVVLGLFCVLPPRRAVIAAFVGGWLLLPMAGIHLPGILDYTKTTATMVGALLGVVIFDASRLWQFRLKWFDMPMAAWCLMAAVSSLSNGYGPYDAVSAIFGRTLLWGLPYVLGRTYFAEAAFAKDLALAIFLGGLLYVPLCLYEIRMSPQLHTMIYGYHQHSFAQTIRSGGYRPTVFMQHGLAVGFWMASAAVAGFWLWRGGGMRRLAHLPMWLLVTAVTVTAILCKSGGALVLLLVGLGTLYVTRWTRTALPVLLLTMSVFVYCAARIGFDQGVGLVIEAAAAVSEERAGSLEYRLRMEDRLLGRTMQKPLLGWGGWGEYRDVDDGDGKIVTDSLWIIALGENGLVGLGSLLALVSLPSAMLLKKTGMRGWNQSFMTAPSVLAVMLALYALDCMVNAMINPVFILMAGALGGFAGHRRAATGTISHAV